VVRSEEIETSPRVREIIEQARSQADFCIFLSGGASKMTLAQRKKVFGLYKAFQEMAESGERFLVGDGGTGKGVMEAVGLVRRASKVKFPLIGVAAAPNLLPGGSGEEALVPKYSPQRDHTEVIAVSPDPAWLPKQKEAGWEPSWGFWGSETPAMYSIFSRLAEGRPSVTILANGGPVTLEEIKWNIRQGRHVIPICGSGRVTDLVCAELFGTESRQNSETDRAAEVKAALKGRDARGTNRLRARFYPFHIQEGAGALAPLIDKIIHHHNF